MSNAIANRIETSSTSIDRPEASAGIPARHFAPPLLFKITLPYVALALVLALAVIYVVARMNAVSVASAWGRQVQDTQLRVADAIVRTEQSQLADVRTLARLSGLAQAVDAGDQQAALGLVEPYAISQNIERVILVDMRGHVLSGLRVNGAGAVTRVADPNAASWPFVAAVLRRSSDSSGDKFAGLVAGQEPTLYTAAPLYDGEQPAGVLVIGTTARTLTERWRTAGLADVTLYNADGAVLISTFGADTPGAIVPAQVSDMLARDLALGSRTYTELITPLVLRAGTTPQFVGVALSKAGEDGLLREAEVLLLATLAFGIIAAILLGTTISSRITRPITALVCAAEGVAAGDLDHHLPVTTGDEVGALTTSFNTMIGGLRERERMHDILGRFVSPTVARLVLSRPLALSGENKTLTILFTDLRDFTVMTEREDPAVVISGLNEYFRVVVEAADRYGGIVNKFGGDSTLVLFGLTDEEGDAHASAEAAVRAAIDIRAGMDKLNQQRVLMGQPELVAGIGINTGAVIAGLIGAERRMEYTVIGDAVNLSARIQALNRELEGGILISEATYTALGAPLDLMIIDYGVHKLKGKSHGVGIYAVVCWETSDVI